MIWMLITELTKFSLCAPMYPWMSVGSAFMLVDEREETELEVNLYVRSDLLI